ncbi:hypothetical protein B0H15DRAFT_319867 [Mycena belliarum]|uniref:Uncharacterized protein n=1 Tax=Mycena belliarum TaxID=1033014 RepID=A0AAD6UFW3_9AGAR|nr:hypothetical protein B0H15DRAFT_319867 [Mycena belliae]
MGNFKHQSLRDRDRDRDRDGDKDRERDIRDKEGQERLRNLSDKYDRDRLAAPNLRSKERDIAPHLAVDSATRGSAPLSAAARRAEARDGAKKKVGEVSEDWRRGTHITRQERYETRATREDRERPRSRGRDSSRSRRDQSAARTEDKEPGGDRRDDHRKPPRDENRRTRDDRRERDERRERERDVDRDTTKDEDEDPRRWRDDGRRDERLAAKRADRHAPGEKAPQENGESSGDRRWTVVEERDGRSKRNHRDRRTGASTEECKDREDRRDREREKEPAWMDTYIPDSTGILGGKGGDGELDGIQAWKKGLKEQKDKTAASPKKDEERPAASDSTLEKPLDEIQLFRLLMKREEEKKQVDPAPSGIAVVSRDADPAPPGIRGPSRTSQAQQVPTPSESATLDLTSTVPSSTSSAAPTSDLSARSRDSNSLLSILGKAEPPIRPSPLAPAADTNAEKIHTPVSSRFFPNPIHHQNSASSIQNTAPNNQGHISHPEKPSERPPSAQFNPPQGSRLLAFGARSATKSAGLPTPLNGITQHDAGSQHTASPNTGVMSPDLPINQAAPKSESLRTGFSPFEDPSPATFGFEETREQGGFSNGLSEPLRRGERVPYIEAGSFTDPTVFDPSSAGYSAGKGSRLAKFFDSKGRDAQVTQNPGGFTSSSTNPGQRHDGGFNPMDHRVMDGLLSKLNSSAQVHRPNAMAPNSAPSAGVSFGQQAQNNLQILQHQQHQQQQHHSQAQHLHLHSNNRLDSLYESRLDDRNFVPDGMVPGLRSAPPPRSRDNVGMYSDSLDDSIHFNPPRLPPQHHRGIDPMYNPVPSVYAQQGGRNGGMPMQPQYRGAPSPISNSQQQRLPPGLANLGGRPPLEGSQFMGMPGLPSAGLHHPNAPPQQQPFNNFAVNGNLNYGAGLQPQMRVPPSSAHQLQGNLQHHQLANLGHTNLDLRSANQAQLLGLGSGGMRGVGMGGFAPQQGPPAQMQQPIHALRQQEQQQRQQQLHHQQQQQLPPHMMSHHLPHPHQQGSAQPDLMALLMGGTVHRD